MRILIADKLSEEHVQRLRKVAEEVEYEPDLTSESLVDRIRGTNILVLRGTKVTAEVVGEADALELIVRSGAGTENIDMEAASAQGIYITSCPDKNSAAVAELTIGLPWTDGFQIKLHR